MTYVAHEAGLADIPAIARLHRQAIASGFLSTLGVGFLCQLYRSMRQSPQTYLLGAYAPESSILLGFVAGALDTSSMYRYIALHNGFALGLSILPSVFVPSRVSKILETIRYGLMPRRGAGYTASHSQVTAELLSIAVASEWRGRGVGKALVAALERAFSLAHTSMQAAFYKVVTDANTAGSNSFYLSCGFTLVRTFAHHGRQMCEYQKAVPPRLEHREETFSSKDEV